MFSDKHFLQAIMISPIFDIFAILDYTLKNIAC